MFFISAYTIRSAKTWAEVISGNCMDVKKNCVNGLIEGFLSHNKKYCEYLSPRIAEQVINEIKHLFYPEVKKPLKNYDSPSSEAEDLYDLLFTQISVSLDNDLKKVESVVSEFFKALPSIKETLDGDLSAFRNGDPAAESDEEIILCYPGFHAVFTYRLANALYRLGVPVLPRIFTEVAHKTTGIDIHPGATIGKQFFIDHGTGVVIGETSEIGNNVSIYQGVTLGAISLKNARSLKGVKRHPTVLDGVTIYANATVLGGNTIIGENVTIPSAAFITESVFKNNRNDKL